MVNGLLGIQLFGILDTKAEEITQLSSRVNLSLPGVLALAVHSKRHNIIAVLGANQISSLQEDAGTLSEGSRSPRLASSESRSNGVLDIRLGSVRVGRDRSVGGWVALSEGLRALDLLARHHQRQRQGTLRLVLGQRILQALAIRGSGRIVFVRFVVNLGNLESRVGAHGARARARNAAREARERLGSDAHDGGLHTGDM